MVANIARINEQHHGVDVLDLGACMSDLPEKCTTTSAEEQDFQSAEDDSAELLPETEKFYRVNRF